ncbi:MAG: 4'-phosphopantetheinyl transferase superfamily protein [Chryseolinea sp.]
MPLEKIVSASGRAWALWCITEDETSLVTQLGGIEEITPTITNGNKRLEWLAGRLLVSSVFLSMSLKFQGLTKDPYGKPSPIGCDHHVSLSHSFPYVAALVDHQGPVGIDLEQPKEKLFRIASRVLHPIELADAGNELKKHCIYWCAKEALIKIYGKKDLTLAENLRIDPFHLAGEGDVRGRIIVSNRETIIPLHYFVFPNFVMVLNERTFPL